MKTTEGESPMKKKSVLPINESELAANMDYNTFEESE